MEKRNPPPEKPVVSVDEFIRIHNVKTLPSTETSETMKNTRERAKRTLKKKLGGKNCDVCLG